MTSESDRIEEFVRLFSTNQRRIYSFVASVLIRSVDADDVFGEISASLWQKFDSFTAGTDFLAWSLQFARYAILKHYRAQRSRKRLVFDNGVVESLIDEAVSASQESDQVHDALRTCLDKLPERSRDLVRIRYEGDAGSCRDVANRTGRSVEAVYKAMRSIHKLLLRCIERTRGAEYNRE